MPALAEIQRPEPAPISHEFERSENYALIYPGQGEIPRPGTGYELAEKHPEIVGPVLKTADEVLDWRISNVFLECPPRLLRRTDYLQQVRFLINHVNQLLLEEDGKSKPIAVAGHSSGEYNALVASGATTFEDTLALIDARARSMAYACRVNPSGLMYVKDATDGEMRDLERMGHYIALLNEQTIFGGRIEALEKAEAKYGSRYERLEVDGAFHTPLMREAVPFFELTLYRTPFKQAQIPIIANTTAEPITEPDDIKKELVDHIYKRVLMRQVFATLHKLGVVEAFPTGERQTLIRMLIKIAGGFAAGAVLYKGTRIAHRWLSQPENAQPSN